MATADHLSIIKLGVDAWNRWRESEHGIVPDLSDADLQGANLRGANLTETDLVYADLRNADLTRADLLRANLAHASLRGTNLSGVSLNKANLRSANLMQAILDGGDYDEVNFFGVKMWHTLIGNVDLRRVNNIEHVIHHGPSIISLNTIYRSMGHIPETFLRGCGVPEEFIIHIPALLSSIQPIQFYSCFISYSSRDENFAKRLYADLQNEGVRCWFAPEDLKIGERFRVRIDESIRLYDKLLLVLSESSGASQWVEKEVETAFEKEREQGKTVLFPVRLDDAVLEAKTGWAADVRRSRHVGDFRDWKNHDSYRKAFERLMRDLKAEASR